jgi:hypothetical protein
MFITREKSTFDTATSEASRALHRPSLSSTIDANSVITPTLVGKESASSTLNDESSEASTIIAEDVRDSAKVENTSKKPKLPGLRKRLADVQKFFADREQARLARRRYLKDCEKRQAEKNDGRCPCGYPWGSHHWYHSCSTPPPTSACPSGGGVWVDGCFGGDGGVWMADGRHKLVRDLRKGDRIRCDAGSQTAEVQCVVAMRVKGCRAPMVHFPSGLAITPTHPVLDNSGDWVPAEKVHERRVVDIDRVYNFLLDRQHTIVVNGVICVVMGHGGPMKHAFWGNWNRVARCLCAADREGFKDGLVELAGAVRNESTGMVYGFESLDGRRIVEDDLSSRRMSLLNIVETRANGSCGRLSSVRDMRGHPALACSIRAISDIG